VVTLAASIAGLAVLEALVGLGTRWFSSRIGEGLIVDLRRAVFEHVQRMPVAFFTRTRTGALVSRLNNDVLGAQSAITSTLASVLSNVIQLVLALAVMITLAWQVTLLALVLLPVFVLPARRMGRTIAGLRRENADLNAAMGTQMTERFSAPGATLVKLFGRPAEEAAEFGERAGRIRDIGVRTAMVSRVFVTSLSLVSALAQALIYGLGGYLAVTGQIEPGTVVTLALLLSRLYTPMTALANARVDVMTALVSFERVFEVLDLKPMITERPGARSLPDGPVPVRLRDVRFAYPGADRVSLASLEEVAVLDNRVGAEVLHGIDLEVGEGEMVALVGSSGAGKSTIAALVPRLYDVDSGAVELSGIDVRDLTFAAVRGAVGVVTQDGHLFHDTIRANLAYAAPGATDAEIHDALRRARLGELIEGLPDGLDTVVGERGYRLSGGERQRLTIARLLLARPPGGDPGRGHRAPGLGVRGRGAGGAGRGAGRADGDRHRAPAVHGAGRGPDRRDRPRPDRRARDARRTAGRERSLRRAAPHPVRRPARRRPRRGRRARGRRGRGASRTPSSGQLSPPLRPPPPPALSVPARRTDPSTTSSTGPSSSVGRPMASWETSPSSTSSRKRASTATSTSSRTVPAPAWRASRSRVAAVSAAALARQCSRKPGSVRPRRTTSRKVPVQPACSASGAASSSRMTWTRPCSVTIPAIRRVSCSATARNSASLSRKWWKIAPRDSPTACSSRRTVAPS
jgi:ABC-type multidrug transport system fused ATPase/permease subunit